MPASITGSAAWCSASGSAFHRATAIALHLPRAEQQVCRAPRPAGTCSALMAPLSELLHDLSLPTLAIDLWVAALPQIWSQLQQPEQEGLIKPIIAILSKDHNLRQQTRQPNIVQGLLQAVAACRPLPKLPAALLKFLAKTFNAWPVAMPLLTQQALYYPTEPQWYDALSELYMHLGDRCAPSASAMTSRLWLACCVRSGMLSLAALLAPACM